jgi:hypothetical protein
MEADDADDFLGLDGPDAAFKHREDRARPQVEAIVEAGCRQEYAADAHGSGGHHVGDGLPRIFSFSAMADVCRYSLYTKSERLRNESFHDDERKTQSHL